MLSRWETGAMAARALLYLCIVQFLFSYGIFAFDKDRNPERRIEIKQSTGEDARETAGSRPVLAQHIFQDEWVYNAADIDGSRVLGARFGRYRRPETSALLSRSDGAAAGTRRAPSPPEPYHPGATETARETGEKQCRRLPFEPVA